MIKHDGDAVYIKFSHPCPAEGVTDLREALMYLLQIADVNEFTDLEEYREHRYVLLEFLKEISPK